MDFELAQLALIFAPGLIWANIDEKYGAGKPPNTVKFFVRSFLFVLMTYAVLYLTYYLLGFETKDLRFEFNSSEDQSALTDLLTNLFSRPTDFFWSIPLSLCLSIFWLYIVRFKWLRKTLHFLRATKRYGDEDLWSTILDEDSICGQAVHFRDFDKDLIFSGYVESFSQNEVNRELVLKDTVVRTNGGQKLFDAPRLYVSCEKNSFLLEFPTDTEKEGENDGK